MELLVDTPADDKLGFSNRRNRWNKTKVEDKKAERQDLDLVNAVPYFVDVGGDVNISEEEMGKAYLGLHFHDSLPENYRKFIVEPKQIPEGKILTGILRAYREDEHTKDRKSVKTFDFDVEPEAVKAYFYVEPDPEPEQEAEPEPEPDEEVVEAPPKPVVKPRPMANESFMRLITPTKAPRKSMNPQHTFLMAISNES